ncbi:MAG: hypothetical protein ACYCZF_09820 [Anaerolineae bacterium]
MTMYRDLGEPCRNYNILGVADIKDPFDGRPKVVLSSYVAEGTGCLVLVDPATGQGEQLPLPADSGAWALLNDHDEHLLVGTCATFGYLHSLDLRTRTWAQPLRVEGETYIWHLCVGSDGLVYGGTWPGCVLLRYDARSHQLTNLGKVSDVAGNCYSRYVHGQVPGKIMIDCGWEECHTSLYDIAAGTFQRFGEVGEAVVGFGEGFLCTRVGEARHYYSTPDLTPLDQDMSAFLPAQPVLPYKSEFGHHIWLEDKSQFTVRGQSYYILSPQVAEPALIPIPTERPPTAILGLAVSNDGCVWGSSAFGQTIFSYHPKTGDTWNSETVCNMGGEVYGMSWINDRLFMSSYAHGDHIVYDPAKSWDQVHNINPITLQAGWPRLVRPGARSIVGPDGAFYTGWWAQYGVYGGGVSRVDPQSLEVTFWHGIVPNENLVGMASDSANLYLVTTQRANGLPEHSEKGHFVVWHPQQGVIDQHTVEGFVPNWGVSQTEQGAVIVIGNSLLRYDAVQRHLTKVLDLPEEYSYILHLQNARILLFGQHSVFQFDASTNCFEYVGAIPGAVRCAVQAPDGTIYLASGSHLYQLS